jgi:3-deoxy-D-manno-octulosonic-acid transferase
VRPELVSFVKYEFWHHYLHELKRREITAVAVSAIFRPGQVFFQPWGGFFRKILTGFTHIFTQNKASADLLRGIGLTQVSVAGDTRFDTVVATATARPRTLPLLDAFVSDWAPVFIIGSSWTEDLTVLTPLLRRYQGELRFLVAPHEINEANLAAVEAALPGQVLRYSQATKASAGAARLLLIDNVGLLSQLYRYGHYAYIGGAFGKGLHNTLEAAAFGLPLFFGPTYAKFQEAVDLVELGCAFPVTTADELQLAFGRLYHDEAMRLSVQDKALDYVHEQAGATNRILKQLSISSE